MSRDALQRRRFHLVAVLLLFVIIYLHVLLLSLSLFHAAAVQTQ